MKSELTFRYATVDDFAAVLELASQLAVQIEVVPPPLTVAQFETYYLSLHAPMRLLLAIRDGRTVGMISWTLTHELYSADTRVYISDVSVDRTARGQGIGAALMAEVKSGRVPIMLPSSAGRFGTETLRPRPFMIGWEPPSMKKLSPTSYPSKTRNVITEPFDKAGGSAVGWRPRPGLSDLG